MEPMSSSYHITRRCGIGASGSVYEATNQKTNEQVIMKCVKLTSPWKHLEFQTETKILSHARKCPQIIPMVANSYVTSNTGVIILKKMRGDLLDYLERKKFDIPRTDQKRIFKQICLALDFLHERNMAHLDIKPENVFLDDYRSVHLGDLGGGFIGTPKRQKIRGITGTSFYCAPEMHKGAEYSPFAADVWSLGILLHVLLTGTWPYLGLSPEDIQERVILGEISLSALQPKDRSMIPLLSQILSLEPSERPSIKDILACKWLSSIKKEFNNPEQPYNLRSSTHNPLQSNSDPSLSPIAPIATQTPTKPRVKSSITGRLRSIFA